MSSTMGGFAIREGRHNFAIMPATIQCDSRRRAIKDNRPLTRAQLEKMGLVYPKPTTSQPVSSVRRLTKEQKYDIVTAYLHGEIVQTIAKVYDVNHTSIIWILRRANVYIPSRERKAKP